MKMNEGIDEIWEDELRKMEIAKFCKAGIVICVLLSITIFLIIHF